jgi:hypothetical protein
MMRLFALVAIALAATSMQLKARADILPLPHPQATLAAPLAATR